MRFAQGSYGSVDSRLPRHSACGPWLYTTERCSFRNLPDCSSGCSDLLAVLVIGSSESSCPKSHRTADNKANRSLEISDDRCGRAKATRNPGSDTDDS